YEFRIAVKLFTVSESKFRRLHLQMDEVRAGRVKTIQPDAFQQRELLKQDWSLAPDAGFADGVAAVVVGERKFDLRLPVRHIIAGQYAAVALPAHIHDLLRAVETINCLRHKSLRPDFTRALDLRCTIASRAFGLLEQARVRFGQPLVGEQCACFRHFSVWQIDRGRCRPVLAEQALDERDGRISPLDQWMTVLRITDRGAEHLAEVHGAVIAQYQHPCVEHARDAGGQQARPRNEIDALRTIVLNRCFCRRGPLSPDHFRAGTPCVMKYHRDIPTRPIQMWLDNLKREGCRHSGIEGVAAFFQRGHADSRCDPMGRCYDPEGAVDLGPGREWIWIYFRHGEGQRQTCEPKRQWSFSAV